MSHLPSHARHKTPIALALACALVCGGVLILALWVVPGMVGTGDMASVDAGATAEADVADTDATEMGATGEPAAGVVGEDPAVAMDGSVGDVVRWDSSDDVSTTASALLASYRDGSETAILQQVGYLDLLGNVWGCTVQGPSWVDVCLVSASDGGSSVSVMRMEVDRWEESYGEIS